VTVHGRDEVVVIAAEEFRRLKGDPRGKRSFPLCRHRRIVTSISSRGACACRCATLPCDELACWIPMFYLSCAAQSPIARWPHSLPPSRFELLYVSAVTLAEIRFGSRS